MKKSKRKQDLLQSIGTRCQSDTPPFFRKVRTVGLVIAAVGATILASQMALPPVLVTFGEYMVLGGSVLTAVSQAAVLEEDCEEK